MLLAQARNEADALARQLARAADYDGDRAAALALLDRLQEAGRDDLALDLAGAFRAEGVAGIPAELAA
jgi:hypothetical protein